MVKQKIGQVKFFKVCDALRTHREEIQATCHSKQQAMDYLAAKVDCPIPESAFASMLSATGIDLKFLRKDRNGKNEAATNRRITIGAIIKIYEELGMEVHEEFAGLYQRSFGRSYRPPVKVASLPEPHKIAIAGGGR